MRKLSMEDKKPSASQQASSSDRKSNEGTPCNYITGQWNRAEDLLVMLGEKVELSPQDKQTFLEGALADQLDDVLASYTLNELKMPYMKYCIALQCSPDMDAIKGVRKLRLAMKDIILEYDDFYTG